MNLIDAVKNFKLDYEDEMICTDIWTDMSASTQRAKLEKFNLQKYESEIFKSLQQRPKLLVHIAKKLLSTKSPTFCEVGTAQGMQSIIFANCFPHSNVYTCDIVDDRSTYFESLQRYSNVKFVLGNSRELSKKIGLDNKKLDFVWVDGSHDENEVSKDFISLFRHSHEDTIWAFDDFEKRFGCYKDINMLLGFFKENCVVELGVTASGQPNVIAIAKGFI